MRRRRHAARVNIDDGERWVSLIGGSLLLVFGLSRGGRGGGLAALGGGALIYRAARGHSRLYKALRLEDSPMTHVAAVTSLAHRRGVTVQRAVNINKPVDEVYAFWRDFENLPRFMCHLESVTREDARRSHWVARSPAGRVAWDAEIVDERPNELIAWRSLADSDVRNAGTVIFERGPGGRGTTIRVSLSYAPPGGTFVAVVAKLFGAEPGQQIRDDLRRLKQLMEAGEVPTVDGQPRGFGGPQLRGPQVQRGFGRSQLRGPQVQRGFGGSQLRGPQVPGWNT
jgi:uncharacterized membrane protein